MSASSDQRLLVNVIDVYSTEYSACIPVNPEQDRTISHLKTLIHKHHVCAPHVSEQRLVWNGRLISDDSMPLTRLLSPSSPSFKPLGERGGRQGMRSASVGGETSTTPDSNGRHHVSVHLLYSPETARKANTASVSTTAVSVAASERTNVTNVTNVEEISSLGGLSLNSHATLDKTATNTMGSSAWMGASSAANCGLESAPTSSEVGHHDQEQQANLSQQSRHSHTNQRDRISSQSSLPSTASLHLPYGAMYQNPWTSNAHLTSLNIASTYSRHPHDTMTPTPTAEGYMSFGNGTPVMPSTPSSVADAPDLQQQQHQYMLYLQWMQYCAMCQQMQWAYMNKHHHHRRHHRRRGSNSSSSSESSSSTESSTASSIPESEESETEQQGQTVRGSTEQHSRHRQRPAAQQRGDNVEGAQGQHREDAAEPQGRNGQAGEQQDIARQRPAWLGAVQNLQLGLLFRLSLVTLLLTRGRSAERQYTIIVSAFVIYLYHLGAINAIFRRLWRCFRNREAPEADSGQTNEAVNHDNNNAAVAVNNMNAFEYYAARLRVGGVAQFNAWGNLPELVNERERVNNQNRVPMLKGFVAGFAALVMSFILSVFPTWLPPPEPLPPQQEEDGNGENLDGGANNGEARANNAGHLDHPGVAEEQPVDGRQDE
eukprot:gb/GECG01013539.1/.p1 GENE.gb/GECG01013539.1/~~gb/GECG01013539.1/.p1  ORF type:complete len:656 (+),score=78.12 gb/GECG01013539.1/:1-1968(+)